MRTLYIGHWVPPSALVLLLTVAGLSMVIGLRKLAGTLFLLVIGAIMVPPFLHALWPVVGEGVRQAPELAQEVAVSAGWPGWMGGVMVIAVAVWLARLVLGRDVWAQMAGTLLADLVRFLLTLPFRILLGIIRTLANRHRR